MDQSALPYFNFRINDLLLLRLISNDAKIDFSIDFEGGLEPILLMCTNIFKFELGVISTITFDNVSIKITEKSIIIRQWPKVVVKLPYSERLFKSLVDALNSYKEYL